MGLLIHLCFPVTRYCTFEQRSCSNVCLNQVLERLASKIIMYILMLKCLHFRDFFFSLEMSFCSWAGLFSRAGVCPLHGLHFSAAGCSGFLYAMRPAKGTCVRQSWGSRVARQGASSFHSPQTNWPFWPFSLASIPGLYAQHCLFLLSHSTSLYFSCRNVHPGK